MDAATVGQVDFQMRAIPLLSLVDRRHRPSPPYCHLSAFASSVFRFARSVDHLRFHPPSDHCKSVCVTKVALQNSHPLHLSGDMRLQVSKKQQRQDLQEVMSVIEHALAYTTRYG